MDYKRIVVNFGISFYLSYLVECRLLLGNLIKCHYIFIIFEV